MMTSPREELLRLQKDIFRRNQKIISDSIVIQEPDFQKYERSYRRAVRRYQSVSSVEAMLQAILQADIIYVGDYHTCNQSQRSFLRILKEIVTRDPNFGVGLELLHKQHQKILDAYMGGKLSEETFLKKVRLKEHWVFDLWDNFKPVFDFAHYHNTPLYAVNWASGQSSILKRDEATARLLARILKEHPGRRLFVLIGDLHLAPSHLPLQVLRACREFGFKPRDLILHQNSETIYWDLAAKGLEDQVEVVQVDDRSFCRMHTPPVVCQRSYLNWLEHEEGEIDYDDAKHSFLELVDRVCKFLKIDLGPARDRVEVFTSGDLSFLDRLSKDKRFNAREMQSLKRQILMSDSYYIPKSHTVYLSNLSLNHAAEEAAHFIKHLCSGSEKERPLNEAFYANVLHEALGFFGSKMVNHKRKCLHERDFEKHLTYFRTIRIPRERRLEYETALLISAYKKGERRGYPVDATQVYQHDPDLFYSVTHALGYMLGDRLYYGLVNGILYKPEVRQLFYDPWRGEGKTFRVYWDLLQKLRGVRIPKRM